MVVYPSYKGRADGRGEQGDREYNPSDFKIKMDVGWVPIDKATEQAIDKATGVAGSGTALADEIKKINKTYLLNRVGEDIQLKEDGSVDINIEFRAYVESLMKMNDLDALTSPEVYEMKKKRQSTIDDAVKNKKCTEHELKMIKQALEGEDEKIGAAARRSIMTRLIKNGKIYSVDLDTFSRNEFEEIGFFKNKPNLQSSVRQADVISETNPSNKKITCEAPTPILIQTLNFNKVIRNQKESGSMKSLRKIKN